MIVKRRAIVTAALERVFPVGVDGKFRHGTFPPFMGCFSDLVLYERRQFPVLLRTLFSIASRLWRPLPKSRNSSRLNLRR